MRNEKVFASPWLDHGAHHQGARRGAPAGDGHHGQAVVKRSLRAGQA